MANETSPLSVEGGEDDYENEDGSGENSPEDEIGQEIAVGEDNEQR